MEQNEELQMAWDIVERTGANLFLTGKAGTGKTTFLRQLHDRSKKRMVVLAPTGIAAINAGGVTIHSFFQLPLSPYLPGSTFSGKEQQRYALRKNKIDIIKTIDLIVIDEISMVRADLLDAVDSVMRRYRNRHRPFGGAQLLMIGDLQQLAPVVKDDDWQLLSSVYASPYFFSSKALQEAKYQTIELKKVYRQQDKEFIALLNQIRENKATADTLCKLNEHYKPNFRPDKRSNYIRLTTHNQPANKINEQELEALPGKAHTFKAAIKGDFPETLYPADEMLTLKQGAQVMFIKNDPDHRFYNGMIGEVVFIDDSEILVRNKADEEDEPFYLEPMEWTNAKYTIDEETKEIKEKIEGTFRQYPLRLAWAITIHKSQGMTFDHAIIDASRSFAHGQTYVALSRLRSLDGLVLSQPLSSKAIIADRQIDAYTTDILSHEPTANTVSQLRHNYSVQLLDELFDLTTVIADLMPTLRTIEEHLYKQYPKHLADYRKMADEAQELNTVAQRFKAQYTRMLAANPDIADPQLQERINKAVDYFLTHLKPLHNLLATTKFTIGNKVTKKQFTERFTALKDSFNLKEKLLQFVAKNKFTPDSYLNAKAKILLD